MNEQIIKQLSMYPTWQTPDGSCLLINADYSKILPLFKCGDFDAIITDPPYGIQYEASRYPHAKFKGVIIGDDIDFDPTLLLALSVPTIFWGGNNFSAKLPRGGWLCWDKRCSANADKMFGSPFELAWISDTRKFKMLRLQHGGVINADGYGHKRLHPTQKPINLMLWCIEFIDGTTILDPFMGSGTTGVACLKTKRRFIGIEINPAYYAIAVMRCKATYGDNHE